MVQVRCKCAAANELYTECAHKGGIAYAGWLGAELRLTGLRAAIREAAPQVANSLQPYACVSEMGIEGYVASLHAAERVLTVLLWPGVDLHDETGAIVLTCHAGDWLYEDVQTGDVWSITDAGLCHIAYDALFDRYNAAGTWADVRLADLPDAVRASLREAAQSQGDAPPVGTPKPAAVRLTNRTTAAAEVFEDVIETLYDALAEATIHMSSLQFVPVGH